MYFEGVSVGVAAFVILLSFSNSAMKRDGVGGGWAPILIDRC